MSHWLVDSSQDLIENAFSEADKALLQEEFSGNYGEFDFSLIEGAAEVFEMVVLESFEVLASNFQDDLASQSKIAAANAFKLFRVLPKAEDPRKEAERRLRQSLLAVIGDKAADAARLLREDPWPELSQFSENWKEKTWHSILDVWFLLIRKNGWEDRDLVLAKVSELKDIQKEFEKDYLDSLSPHEARYSAFELIIYYHLARAAEILAIFVTDGAVDGNFQVSHLLDAQFDRALKVCSGGQFYYLEPIVKLLALSAQQMIANSIWTVTRAVNSRVTQFVKELVGKGRGNKALFEVLPPQRKALAEEGLLGSSRRAVVVSLPTSSGKTLIAQFRMLQALNQFDAERGWVAYLAPTRTLVNQVARKLRKDFGPLGVVVEQVGPALEVDGIEADILSDGQLDTQFRVLVSTPEKLDLLLRQGWESEIGRPLTLVVVDEAHNIQSDSRGLKLELLLSTINKECQRAQFLLLTPFIQNASEVARWLGGGNSDDISLALDWQPNDRVVGVVNIEKGEKISGSSFGYDINLESVHTSRNTLFSDEKINLNADPLSATTFSKVSSQKALAAVASKSLAERGPVIVMHSRPDWVWSLADQIKREVVRKSLTVVVK